MPYARRGFKGGVRSTTLNGAINDAVTTIAGADLSTWSGTTTNGAATATISRGQSDEETITFTGVSGGNLTGVTRGAAGTTAQAHASGATLEHTSSVTDFDEANAHIADTTLNHHTQYALLTGATFTGAVKVTTTGVTIGASSAPARLLDVIGASPARLSTSTTDGFEFVQNSAKNWKWVQLSAASTLAFDAGTIQTLTGSFRVGTAAIATGATTGFLGLPNCAGAPSGVADVAAAMVYDSTNNKIYVFNGAWRSTAALT